MPGKRPPPRGAPKGKPEPKSKSGQKAAPKGAPKPKSSTGIPQAAIDASNAARRAGLGGVARKGASEVMSPRKGDAPARNAPQQWTADDWTDEGDVRRPGSGCGRAGEHQGASDRQPRHRQQGAGGEPAGRRRQRLRRCRGSDRRAEAAAALRECSARVRARPLRRGTAAAGALGPRRSCVVGCARALRPDALSARRVPKGGDASSRSSGRSAARPSSTPCSRTATERCIGGPRSPICGMTCARPHPTPQWSPTDAS